ncbi:MAG: hypothetical protein H7839_07565 [Magnetococcus sp. YQC-5]
MNSRSLAKRLLDEAIKLLLLTLCTGGSVAEAGSPPLSITADRLEMDDKNQVALFLGHVTADDGRMRLAADRMTVYYDKKGKGGGTGGGVREVKAEGQVIIQQEKDKGIADVVHYQMDKHTLELLGKEQDASIRRGEDLLTGRRILVSLDQNQQISKVSVQGGGESHRVSARISSSGLLQRMETPLRMDSSRPANQPDLSAKAAPVKAVKGESVEKPPLPEVALQEAPGKTQTPDARAIPSSAPSKETVDHAREAVGTAPPTQTGSDAGNTNASSDQSSPRASSEQANAVPINEVKSTGVKPAPADQEKTVRDHEYTQWDPPLPKPRRRVQAPALPRR